MFAEIFDRFEFILGLAFMEQYGLEFMPHGRSWVGIFKHKDFHWDNSSLVAPQTTVEGVKGRGRN